MKWSGLGASHPTDLYNNLVHIDSKAIHFMGDVRHTHGKYIAMCRHVNERMILNVNLIRVQ